MRTSMPYGTRIRVTPENIAGLRAASAGACLAWNENSGRNELVNSHDAARSDLMIITSQSGLRELESLHRQERHEVDDDHLARDLTDIAADLRNDWPGLRAVSPPVEELRLYLADQQVHLHQPPEFTLPEGSPTLTEHYELDEGEYPRVAVVTIGFGFLTPTRVLAYTPNDDTRPVIDLSVSLQPDLSQARICRLLAEIITAALRQAR
ncbi:hypothetical protein ABZ631_20495 [Nocardiopsis alba]|uniref:hypothetical protein n=1 Tax=Nocardiopsis alba TaxID=53437 RepID=UPI0033F7AF8A